jgi:hypothetical protein
MKDNDKRNSISGRGIIGFVLIMIVFILFPNIAISGEDEKKLIKDSAKYLYSPSDTDGQEGLNGIIKYGTDGVSNPENNSSGETNQSIPKMDKHRDDNFKNEVYVLVNKRFSSDLSSLNGRSICVNDRTINFARNFFTKLGLKKLKLENCGVDNGKAFIAGRCVACVADSIDFNYIQNQPTNEKIAYDIIKKSFLSENKKNILPPPNDSLIGILVQKNYSSVSNNTLDGVSVCTHKKVNRITIETQKYFRANHWKWRPYHFDDAKVIAQAFLDGKCDCIFGDIKTLEAIKSHHRDPSSLLLIHRTN